MVTRIVGHDKGFLSVQFVMEVKLIPVSGLVFPDSEFVSQSEAFVQGTQTVRAGRIGHTCSSGASPRHKAFLQGPTFVHAIEHSGAKGISSTSRTLDITLGQGKRALPDLLSPGRLRIGTFGEMDGDQFASSQFE
jgi:hypothetical protein